MTTANDQNSNYPFKAKIYKNGINWCVDVPGKITDRLTSEKGKIKIKGTINGFSFSKTLMPVKDSLHRLFVNRAMMKGAETSVGQIAHFKIEQNHDISVERYPKPKVLTDQLKSHGVATAFNNLTESRKKDILKYLSYIKTPETLQKNINKLIDQLKKGDKQVRIP